MNNWDKDSTFLKLIGFCCGWQMIEDICQPQQNQAYVIIIKNNYSMNSMVYGKPMITKLIYATRQTMKYTWYIPSKQREIWLAKECHMIHNSSVKHNYLGGKYKSFGQLSSSLSHQHLANTNLIVCVWLVINYSYTVVQSVKYCSGRSKFSLNTVAKIAAVNPFKYCRYAYNTSIALFTNWWY